MKRFVIVFILFIVIFVVSVLYNTLPRLELNGSKNMVISYRDTYHEAGVIVKNANDDYVSKVKIDSNVDTKVIGSYYVDYSLKIGRKTLRVRRNVRVVDDVSPVIKLKGEQIVQVSLNDVYEEPGYKAVDEYDGDITDRVEVIGEVDTSNYGEYVLTYRVTDNSNNKVEVNRIVKVIDEEAPKFVCDSDYSAFVLGADSVIGCSAIDNFDGDITDKIKVEGSYDVNTKGIYKVIYRVSDDASNEASIEHNIVIYDNKEDAVAFLTFDDGPTSITPKILDVLRDYDVKASFFVSPQKNTDNYKYISEELESGYEVGIHGYHDTEELYSDFGSFKSYFKEMQSLLKRETGRDIFIYRFPGGSKSKNLRLSVFNEISSYFDDLNVVYYDWNIDSMDSSSLTITSDEIIKSTLMQVINCSSREITLLFHDSDTKEQTVKALPSIISVLKDMNYQFKTISESKPVQFR